MPERNCQGCRHQVEWGCDAHQKEDGTWVNKAMIPLDIDGEQVWRCPRRPIKDDPAFWHSMMTSYAQYRHGHLPAPGGTDQQPNKLMALISLLNVLVPMAEREAAQTRSIRVDETKKGDPRNRTG